MKRHPSQAELMNYAESVVRGLPISAEIAKHVVACPACRDEVAGKRSSLEFTYEARELEPSAHMAAQILLAVQKERKALEALRRSRRISLLRIFQGLSFAAMLLLVAAAWFMLVSNSEFTNNGHVQSDVKTLSIAEPPVEIVARTSEIEHFARAVSTSAAGPQSAREQVLRRAANVLQADLLEALGALGRNPGSVRANQVMNASLRTQAQTLKQLYVERSL
jgi:hypothetical protein